jgi:hypothetical protein
MFGRSGAAHGGDEDEPVGPSDAGHGWTCEPAPRSRRIDCMIMNVVL